MPVLTVEQEKDAVDLVTNCMFSVSFLQSISECIFSPKRDKITVGQFYDAWLAKAQEGSKRKEDKIPFNPGVFLGYLYCGLLFTKENWFDLLPEDTPHEAAPDWGLSSVKYSFPKKPHPTVRDIVRRIRNALGHGTIALNIPKGITRADVMTEVSVTFRDQNMRDPADTFHIELSLERLRKLIRSFQDVVHRHVREKG